MERGKFYAHSVLFFIVVLTMTHFSDKLSDGAIIIKLVRNVHVWMNCRERSPEQVVNDLISS